MERKTYNSNPGMKKAGIESAFLLEPTFHIENHLIRKGYRVIAGIDETGRGALAGPLCVGVVIYDASFIASTDGAIPGINDSKKLTHRKRIAALDMITRISVHSSCILVSHRTIDRVNINGATEFALNRLLASISFRPDVVILDGNYSFRAPVPIYSIPKGDAKSISIASASIVAKVRRDMILDRLDKLYPGYNFSQNKGYGTEQHRQAIYNIGFSPIHRRSYEPVKSLARSIGHGE